jgi:ligand-binding SRPBCC domain-containing protein
MAVGTRIDYRLRIHGVPVRWQSEITIWEPPVRFVDEQRRGPYQLWSHEHTFVKRDGGTLCRDVVSYAAPGGRLVHRLLVGPDVQRIFEYRREALARVFASP